MEPKTIQKIFVLLFALISSTECANKGLNLTLSYSGYFQIQVQDKIWFYSADPFVVSDGVRYSVNNSMHIFKGMVPIFDKELQMKSSSSRKGSDVLGKFEATNQRYYAGMSTIMDLEIRAYDSYAVFSQEFPNGLENKEGIPDDRDVIAGFPAFQWDFPFLNPPLGMLAFPNSLAGDSSILVGNFDPLNGIPLPAGDQGSGPFTIFNTTSLDAIVISPLSHAPALTSWNRQWIVREYPATSGQTYWGINRHVTSLPKGFKSEVIMVYSGNGTSSALEKWGELFRTYNEPKDTLPRHSVSVKEPSNLAIFTLAYGTGQGSYVFDGEKTGNETYEDLLLDVKKAADEKHVPIGMVELDKWWYDSETNQMDSVVTWEANNQSLPSGIKSLSNQLGLSLIASCGFWSSNNTYAQQNNGPYQFYIEGDMALPLEKEFWQDLFQNASDNSISHVILDDLSKQYFGLSPLRTEVEMASDWIKNISTSAMDAGITLTLSDVTPLIAMQAALYPAIIQIRVSAPYMSMNNNNTSDKDQWKIGVTSTLAKALGMASYKDIFWSHSNETESSDGSEKVEMNPGLQALVATLSLGSVMLGDEPELLGSNFTARCCRSDGLVLKPSKPLTVTSNQLVTMARNNVSHGLPETGQVWASISRTEALLLPSKQGTYTQGIIMAANLPAGLDVTLYPEQTFPSTFQDWELPYLRSWTWLDGKVQFWQEFNQSVGLNIQPDLCKLDNSPSRPCLYYISAPILLDNDNTVVHIAGEDKFVPVALQRISSIGYYMTTELTLSIQGQVNETVTIVYYVNDDPRSVDVTIPVGNSISVFLNVTSSSTVSPTMTSEETTGHLSSITPSISTGPSNSTGTTHFSPTHSTKLPVQPTTPGTSHANKMYSSSFLLNVSFMLCLISSLIL